jgi:hypothetical protein
VKSSCIGFFIITTTLCAVLCSANPVPSSFVDLLFGYLDPRAEGEHTARDDSGREKPSLLRRTLPELLETFQIGGTLTSNRLTGHYKAPQKQRVGGPDDDGFG